MIKFSLIVLVLTTSFFSKAQITDTLFKKYNNGFLYRMGAEFKKGNDKITFQELSKEFSMSDLGLDQYMLAKRKRTTGRIFSFASIASGIVAIAFVKSNRNLTYGFLGGQFVTAMLATNYRRASMEHLDKAIWQRNKDYLFPGR